MLLRRAVERQLLQTLRARGQRANALEPRLLWFPVVVLLHACGRGESVRLCACACCDWLIEGDIAIYTSLVQAAGGRVLLQFTTPEKVGEEV